MYYHYFGMSEAPFSIAVNPRYLFMSEWHRDALAHLLYGVGAGGGFIVLTGEVGTGKTTVNRCLLAQLPDDTDIAVVLNPALNAIELLATVCDELGIADHGDQRSLKALTDSLHRYLLENHQRGHRTVLMIDEAQHLGFDVLEQIRLLTNLETDREKLLQIILIGQPELAQMLARPELRQLNQRVTARYNLQALNRAETAAYIRHRLQVAGLPPGRELFPPRVSAAVYRHTKGIPRLINVLCDRMLMGAYGRGQSTVDMAILRSAVHEVLGEQPSGGIRRWPTALSIAVLVLLAVWWWRGREVPVVDVRSATLAAENVLPTPVGTVSPPVTIDVAVAPGANPPWLLSREKANEQLWQLYSRRAPTADVCRDRIVDGVACVTDTADTWNELALLDRPLLLDVVTSQRFSAAVLLTGIDGETGWVWGGGRLHQTPLASLSHLWTGVYHFYWHPPAGFTRALTLGERSPVVARVASLFARLDGQAEPLADERFNARLQQRVRLFQRAQGLDDDGVVGIQTLLRLNALLAIDPDAARARRGLRSADAAGDQP